MKSGLWKSYGIINQICFGDIFLKTSKAYTNHIHCMQLVYAFNKTFFRHLHSSPSMDADACLRHHRINSKKEAEVLTSASSGKLFSVHFPSAVTLTMLSSSIYGSYGLTGVSGLTGWILVPVPDPVS